MLSSQKRSNLGNVMLLLCALVWGFGMVAQSTATGDINPIAFNGIRFVEASAVLALVLAVSELIARKKHRKITPWNLSTVVGGVICGIALFIGSNLQQYGIGMTTVGKTSFITAMYIVYVPILGLLTGRRPPIFLMYAILISVAGFFLLCINENLSIGIGDAIVLLSSVLYGLHICFIDVFGPDSDPIKLTLTQFMTCAVISVPAMAIAGFPTAEGIRSSLIAILYVGFFSAGVGFTLQTAGQKHTDPSTATLIMSLESVVGIVGGAIFLNEVHTAKELAGCLLVFVGVFLAQMTFPKRMLQFERSNFATLTKKPRY